MSKETPPNISTIKYTIERIIRNHINGEYPLESAKQYIKEYLNSLPIHDYLVAPWQDNNVIILNIAIKLTKNSTFLVLPFTWSPLT